VKEGMVEGGGGGLRKEGIEEGVEEGDEGMKKCVKEG